MARSKEQLAEYHKAYYQDNKPKWKRSRAAQDKVNARRREVYAQDEAARKKAQKAVRDWQNANPAKRKAQRMRVYGIDVKDVENFMGEQRGRCAICGYSDLSKPKVFPVVDHCHKTGNVRGLLCSNCNTGLGKFKDDINLLFSAAMYLHRNG